MEDETQKVEVDESATTQVKLPGIMYRCVFCGILVDFRFDDLEEHYVMFHTIDDVEEDINSKTRRCLPNLLISIFDTLLERNAFMLENILISRRCFENRPHKLSEWCDRNGNY